MADNTNLNKFHQDDREIYPTLSSAVKASIQKEQSKDQTYESPRKKRKIPIHVLQKVSKNSNVGYTIGSILTLPRSRLNIIEKGQVQVRDLLCTVVENRIGRTVCDDQKRNGIRFVYIADYTSFMSIGMPAKESRLFEYDLSEDECSKGNLCVFAASLSGKVAWRPSSNSPSIATFFLNNGSVKKIDISSWETRVSRCLPTSDVLRQISFSKFASSSMYGTKAICGRVDNVMEQDKELILSLEDPVGYTAVSLALEETNESRISKARTKCNAGRFIFIAGIMEVQSLPSSENAALFASLSEVTIKGVEKDAYSSYVEMMMSTPKSHYHGVKPERM